MTVKELINKLQELPSDYEVIVIGEYYNTSVLGVSLTLYGHEKPNQVYIDCGQG